MVFEGQGYVKILYSRSFSSWTKHKKASQNAEKTIQAKKANKIANTNGTTEHMCNKQENTLETNSVTTS